MKGHLISPYPSMISLLHFEEDIVVAISKGGIWIPKGAVEYPIYGYAIGCYLKRRDLQVDVKKMDRHQYDAKGFGLIVPK